MGWYPARVHPFSGGNGKENIIDYYRYANHQGWTCFEGTNAWKNKRKECAKLTQIGGKKKMRTNAYPKTLRLDREDFPVPGKSLQSREKSAIIPLIQYHSCLKHLTRTFLTNDSWFFPSRAQECVSGRKWNFIQFYFGGRRLKQTVFQQTYQST